MRNIALGRWRNWAVTIACAGIVVWAGYVFLQEDGSQEAVAPPYSQMARSNTILAPKTGMKGAALRTIDAPGKAFNQLRNKIIATPGAIHSTAQASEDAPWKWANNPTSQEQVPKTQAANEDLTQFPDEALLERAADQQKHGNIFGARAAYEVVAERGSARGAFGLAETYDPDLFTRHQIRGLKPDRGLALLWYERAAKLGNSEASRRLKGLKHRSSASNVLRRAPQASAK